MADKSFEERVREELSDLRLAPDKQVWENVHTELHAEKKRRWLVWLIALLGLGGASALYYYQTDTSSSENAPQQVVVRTEQNTKPSNNNTTAADSKPKNETILSQTDTKPTNAPQTAANSGNKITIFSAKNKQSASEQPIIAEKQKVNSINTNTPVTNTSKQDSKEVLKQATKPVTENNQSVVAEEEKNMVANKTETRSVSNTPPVNQDVLAKQSTSQLNKSDNETKTEKPESELKQNTPINDSIQSAQSQSAIATVPVTKNERKKWRFFGVAEMGMSAEIHSLRSAGLVFDASSQNIGGGSFFSPGAGLQPGGSFNNSVLYKTPSRSDGMSWSIAVQAVKSIGKKWDLGISLGYNYYSSSVGIGANGTVNATNSATADAMNKSLSDNGSYYFSTDSTRYTNRHHFLMANIDMYRNFRLSNTATLRWRIGSGIGALLSTNALHFDEGRGILYSNRSLVSGLQMNISTGFDFGIGKKQAFYIGPHFSYFPGTSSKEGTNKRHIFNAALRASFAIPGRKK